MNILEAAREYLDNVDNGAEYFYRNSLPYFKFRFLDEDLEMQRMSSNGAFEIDCHLNCYDFTKNDWQVHYAEPKLKSCPFCGNEKPSLYGDKAAWVVCGNCGCTQSSYIERREAITAWNRRDGENK